MQDKTFTYYTGLTFIVKTPGLSKCKIITKDILLTHFTRGPYHDFFDEYNNSLFCSSADNDFDEILKLYNSPVSFDCIAIDRVDVNSENLDWLAEEFLEELKSKYEEEEFYELFFI